MALMHRPIRCLLVLALCVPAALFAQGVTAFTNVTLIDGRGGPVMPDVTVIVRGSTIESVGPTAGSVVPKGAVVVNGRGKVLMPGLADMHVHLTGGWDGERSDFLGFAGYLDALLYAGVTTVHDLGNVLPYVQQLKQEIAAGRLRGPRLFVVGSLVDGPRPIWPPLSFSLTTVEQAPGIVRAMKAGGADNIKAYIGLTEPLIAGLVRAAAAESLRVIADLGFANGSDLGIRAGISAYAHAGTRLMADSTIAAMKAHGMSNMSTLAVLESFSERRLADLTFLRDPLLSGTMPPWFVTELTAHARRAVTPMDTLRRRRFATALDNAMTNIRKLHAAGVPIIAGTDSPYPGVYFGEGLHRELELLVEAGLTPLEAISAATRNAAVFMRDTTWGTVEPGRRADLLLVNGKPHERIAETRRISAVMQAGRLLQRTQLTFAAQRNGNYRTTGSALSTK
jgi:imidazolonepropionase-like amidohydrolase